MAPSDGFAKVHYGFILKSENKIAESIPYLKVRPAVICTHTCMYCHLCLCVNFLVCMFRRVWSLRHQELMMEDFIFTLGMHYKEWETRL